VIVVRLYGICWIITGSKRCICKGFSKVFRLLMEAQTLFH
jgi:hypothetical protein